LLIKRRLFLRGFLSRFFCWPINGNAEKEHIFDAIITSNIY